MAQPTFDSFGKDAPLDLKIKIKMWERLWRWLCREWWCGLVTKSCPTLTTSWTVSRQSPLVHGIFQARTLEWVTISFSRGSSWPRDRTRVSCIAGRFFTTETLEKLFVGSRSEEWRVLMWPREGLLQPPITSAPVGKRRSFLKPHLPSGPP